MSFVFEMQAKAIKMGKKLVLPEGTEPRTIQAARMIKDDKIASEVFLVGSTADIEKSANSLGVDLSRYHNIRPGKSLKSSKNMEKNTIL